MVRKIFRYFLPYFSSTDNLYNFRGILEQRQIGIAGYLTNLPRGLMKTAATLLPAFLVLASPAFATVSVSSPANNSTVTSPVAYHATATSACSKGVAAMGVYVNNQLAVKQNGASLNANLTLSNGNYYTVVQEWDNCGGSTTQPVNITVGAGQTGGTTAVTVSSPANNSNVSSPVTFSAQATTAT